VVVRRIVPGETGPSGGPAMTDLLGVCTAWTPGVSCVVQPESGDPVEIPLELVVSGKPVPPRPAPRLRVSPDEAQRRGLTLFPDLETEPLGDWVLRRSPTATARRANSVLAMAPGPAGAYERVLDFYARHGQRPVAAVLPGSAPEELFLTHGWVPESTDADTVFELASVAGVARALPRDLPEAELEEVLEEVLEEAGSLVTARIGSSASGVAAYGADWVGFRSIEVSPAHRRQGLGLAVVAALVGWGAERGATTAYLQVLADNEPALALYERLGFVEHHRYRYLALPRTRTVADDGARTSLPA
jgi:N-acetylglutamate synthase